MKRARGLFITGTDTEVGKTRVSAALLYLLGADGARSAGCKPVAAGTLNIDGVAVNEDVRALRDASTVPLTDAEIGPCQLIEACAPHVAAECQGRTIDRDLLLRAVQHVAERSDWLVVEGVGGFRVPLGATWDSADFACNLGLPVILVVGLRMGCLNHALLTADAIAHSGLELAGWIGNRIDPAMAYAEASIDALRARLPGPCLGIVPWLLQPSPAAVAAQLDVATLRARAKTFNPSGVSA